MDQTNQNTATVYSSQTQYTPPQAPIAPIPTPPSEKGKPFALKNLIKLLIGLFSVSAALFILFAFVFPNINKKAEKITLSFWGLYEEPQVFASVISDFEKANPSIQITYEKQDIKDYRERLTTRSAQGTGPDIFRFHNTWYPQLSGILLPLPKDTITRGEFNENYYPVTQKDLIKNGGIYGIPLEIDTLSLFVNSDIFKSSSLVPPTTWDDFISVSRNLTVKDNGKIKTAGAAFGTFDNVSHAPDIFSLLLSQDGVNLDDLSQGGDRVGDALNFYTAFAQPDSNVWDATLDPSVLAFSKGNLAMLFGYYWDYFTIKSANPNLNFSILPVPQLSFPNTQIASYYPLGVSVKSKHQKEALLFIKFLAKKDIQNKIYQEEARVRTYGDPPGRVDLADNLKGTPLYNFVSVAKDATSSYFSGETFDNGLNDDFNKLLSTAIDSVLKGASLKDAGVNLSTSFSHLLDKYKIK